ncbi:MAG: hypothetical protein ACP5C3_01040 [Methanomicrobiales archaeon]
MHSHLKNSKFLELFIID